MRHPLILMSWLLVALMGLGAAYAYGTDFDREITVARVFQNTVTDGDGMVTHRYMVADTEGRSYRVEDSLWRWQWRSTDLWARLEEGETYAIRAYGWRIGFLSTYPRIFEVRGPWNGGSR